MAHAMRHKASKRRKSTAEEDALVAERRRLQRSVAQQRTIRKLARALVTAQAEANRELDQLANSILDGKRRPGPADESLEGAHG